MEKCYDTYVMEMRNFRMKIPLSDMLFAKFQTTYPRETQPGVTGEIKVSMIEGADVCTIRFAEKSLSLGKMRLV